MFALIWIHLVYFLVGRFFWQIVYLYLQFTHFKRTRRIENVKRQTDARYGKIALMHFLDGALVLGGESTVQELRDDGRLTNFGRTHNDDFVANIGSRQRLLRVVSMDSENKKQCF